MFPSFLCWIGSFSFFALYVFCIALSLPPYIFLEHFQRQGPEKKEGDERQKQKKDKEKSCTEVDMEVSWWIADLKTDQLNAFRVSSKPDTLEWCMYDKCSV